MNLLKCLIWKHRYVPHCGHTQLYSNTIQCMNAVLNIYWHDYTVIIFIQVYGNHGMAYDLQHWGNLTAHKSDPWL